MFNDRLRSALEEAHTNGRWDARQIGEHLGDEEAHADRTEVGSASLRQGVDRDAGAIDRQAQGEADSLLRSANLDQLAGGGELAGVSGDFQRGTRVRRSGDVPAEEMPVAVERLN